MCLNKSGCAHQLVGVFSNVICMCLELYRAMCTFGLGMVCSCWKLEILETDSYMGTRGCGQPVCVGLARTVYLHRI